MIVLVPASLLRRTVTIEPYQGNSATGPVFGEPVELRARVEGKRRQIRRANAGADIGTVVISTASITIRPDLEVPARSKITAPDPITGAEQAYEVLDVIVGEGLSRPAFLELLVG